MDDATLEAMTSDEMHDALMADLDALIAAGEIDPSEAADMKLWLGEV